jgi:hypothetical protein
MRVEAAKRVQPAERRLHTAAFSAASRCASGSLT